MKILFVSEGYPSKEKPQYCVFLQQQASALCCLGNKVDVLHIQKNKTQESISYKYNLNGIDIFSWLYQTNKISELLFSPKIKSGIYDFLKENQYDIVHLHMGSLRAFIRIVRDCKKLSIPVVMHFAGLNIWNDCFETWKHKLHNGYRNVYKRMMLKKLDACICISDLVSDVLKSKSQKMKTYTVYNGVDCKLFAEKNKKNEIFTVICVANLIPIKGQRYLIEAVYRLIHKGKKIKLILVGEGPDAEKLKKQAIDLNIVENVVFTGSLPYEQVSENMRNADMFIMPSFFEGLGCVYLEAMACGILTCGCNGNNGIKEIIENGVNGFLLKEKDVDSIVEAISFAIENPEQAEKIAIAGKQEVKKYTWEDSAKQLLDIYNQVLN